MSMLFGGGLDVWMRVAAGDADNLRYGIDVEDGSPLMKDIKPI